MSKFRSFLAFLILAILPSITHAADTPSTSTASPAIADDSFRRLRRLGLDIIKLYNVSPPQHLGVYCQAPVPSTPHA